MPPILIVHILAGGVALLSGYLALFVVKGARLHRRSGMVFVYAMLTMATAGFALTLIRGRAVAVNIPAASLTSYLVITALTAVRPPGRWARLITSVMMILVLGVGLVNLRFGVEALGNANGKRHGIPAFPFILFGVVGLLAFVGDLRVLQSGPLTGARRLARHLWRMCFALLIAAMSFFLGQARVIPKPIRIPGLLALPLIAVIVTMLYWLWRVRGRRALAGLVRLRAPETA